jgi:hypothetical protein
MSEAATRPPVYDGWKAIAEALRVIEKTARAYAARAYDPLPVRVDHARRYWIYQDALHSWVNRQDLPYHAHTLLEVVGALPSQQPAAEPTTLTKVAARVSRSGVPRMRRRVVKILPAPLASSDPAKPLAKSRHVPT